MYLFAARDAGPSDFGATFTMIAIGVTAAGVLDFGTNSLWTRDLASGRTSVRAVQSAIAGKFLYSTAALVGALAVAASAGYAAQASIAVAIGISVLIGQALTVGLRAAARADLVALVILTERGLGAAAMAAMVCLGMSSLTALWIALASGALSSGMVAWALAPQRIGPGTVPSARPWSGSMGFGFGGLATSLQSADVAVLSAAGGPAAAGAFGAVSRWTQPMGLAVSAFAQSAAPVIAAANSWEAAWRRIRPSLWLPGLAIFGCILVALISPWIVATLLGEDYADSALVLTVLAVGTIPACCNQPLAIFLQFRGRQGIVGGVLMAGTCAQLVMVALLAPPWGGVGAAVGFAVTQCLILLALVVLVIRLRFRRVPCV